MANDLLSALRTYLSKVSGGEKTPQEIAAALNVWARESSEAIRTRVEEELKKSAQKMGFAKQADLDRLTKDLEELKLRLINGAVNRSSSAQQSKKSTSPQGKSQSSKSQSGKSKGKPAPKKSAARKSGPQTSAAKPRSTKKATVKKSGKK